jgi:hypothetical protein
MSIDAAGRVVKPVHLSQSEPSRVRAADQGPSAAGPEIDRDMQRAACAHQKRVVHQ